MTNAAATIALLLTVSLLLRLVHIEIEPVEIPEHFETIEHIRHALHAVRHLPVFAARSRSAH